MSYNINVKIFKGQHKEINSKKVNVIDLQRYSPINIEFQVSSSEPLLIQIQKIEDFVKFLYKNFRKIV